MIYDKIKISYLLTSCFVGGLFFAKEIVLMKFGGAMIFSFFFVLLPIIIIIIKSFHYKLILSILLLLFWFYISVGIIVENYKAGLIDDRIFYILPLFIPLACICIYIFMLIKKDIFKV